MGIGRLDIVGELDVVEFGAADHPLLLGDRQRLPRRHVVDVLLHVHIAAAGEIGILVADFGGADRGWAVGVLGAVDETQQVAVVEELEAVHLVDDGDRPGHRLGHLAGQLEADVEHFGTDVEEQITRSRRGVMPRAVQLDERVQISGSRSGEQPVPGVGADRRHHRQVLGRVPEADGPHQTGKARQGVVHGRFATLVDGGHQEDGRRSQRRQYRLRQW